MKEQPKGNICKNCESPLPPNAKFCSNCSQKNTDGRFTFRELMENFVDSIFSLDTRIFHTLGALAIPGKLTESFFKGQHVRYYHPVRLFILSGALLIATVTFTLPEEQVNIGDKFWEKREEHFQRKAFFQEMDSLRQAADTLEISKVDFDSLGTQALRLHAENMLDSVPLGAVISLGETITENPMVSVDDIFALSPDSLAKKYNITSFWDRLTLEQNIRVVRSPSSFFLHLLGNSLWMVLVMMPMLALLLKLLYIRRSFLYYEHLIFSFHVHTFFFIWFTLVAMLHHFFGDQILIIGSLLSMLYPVLALKRFYKQSWWKTIAKYLAINVLYIFIAAASFVLGTFASIYLF